MQMPYAPSRGPPITTSPKRETFRGGVTDPFVVHWPKGIKARGEIRTQYAHAVDIVPTVLDALGVTPPTSIRGVAQSPIEGVSFAHTFDEDAAPTKDVTQYFEMFAHRVIDHDGWRAVCPWPGHSFSEGRAFGTPLTGDDLARLDGGGWSCTTWPRTPRVQQRRRRQPRPADRDDLAVVRRSRQVQRPAARRPRHRPPRRAAPAARQGQDVVRLLPAHAGRPVGSGRTRPQPAAHDHRRRRDPRRWCRGVLVSMGGVDGGFVFFVKDGLLRYTYNYVAADWFRVSSNKPVPTGSHALRFEFEPAGRPDIAKGKGSPGRPAVRRPQARRAERAALHDPVDAGSGLRRGRRARRRRRRCATTTPPRSSSPARSIGSRSTSPATSSSTTPPRCRRSWPASEPLTVATPPHLGGSVSSGDRGAGGLLRRG